MTINFYFWCTPNGWKIAIMLEECGLPYNLIGIHRCLGSNLARMEIGIAIATMFEQLPKMQLATDALEWRKNFVFRGLTALPVKF